jgi:hypothetical protein
MEEQNINRRKNRRITYGKIPADAACVALRSSLPQYNPRSPVIVHFLRPPIAQIREVMGIHKRSAPVLRPVVVRDHACQDEHVLHSMRWTRIVIRSRGLMNLMNLIFGSDVMGEEMGWENQLPAIPY